MSAKRWETRIDLHVCMEHARNYFRNHGHEPRAVQNAARFAGLSRAHFVRVFTETYGRTPREQIFKFRMERAASLLLAGLPVGDVAIQVGYEDVNAFGRAFKRWSGETPGRYLFKRAQTAGSGEMGIAQDVPHG